MSEIPDDYLEQTIRLDAEKDMLDDESIPDPFFDEEDEEKEEEIKNVS